MQLPPIDSGVTRSISNGLDVTSDLCTTDEPTTLEQQINVSFFFITLIEVAFVHSFSMTPQRHTPPVQLNCMLQSSTTSSRSRSDLTITGVTSPACKKRKSKKGLGQEVLGIGVLEQVNRGIQ